MGQENTKQKQCDYNKFKRTRYFHGMLLTERDFREEQMYLNEKRKLHNRMLHGWGVVCGLGIEPTKTPSSSIVITPGMALDCQGNEIMVCENFEVDLKQLLPCVEKEAKAEECPEPEKAAHEKKYFVGIKYTEAPSNPLPVYAPGGNCEEKVCEHSRIREGFCIKLFKTPPCVPNLPPKGLDDLLEECKAQKEALREKCIQKAKADFYKKFCTQPYPCPACCCDGQSVPSTTCCSDGESYVILGSIDFRGARENLIKNTISDTMIFINDGRRYVFTPMLEQYCRVSLHSRTEADSMDNPFRMACEKKDERRHIEDLGDINKPLIPARAEGEKKPAESEGAPKEEKRSRKKKA